MYKNKTAIDKFLYGRFTGLFNIRDSLVIYDLSNTSFESRKAHSKVSRHGKDKEKHNDCKQVVFTGVINAQGFIRYSRIYDGNAAETKTICIRKPSNPIKEAMDIYKAANTNSRIPDKKKYVVSH